MEMDDIEVPLGESIIEWLPVEEGSPIVGDTLEECAVRQRTGASVIAVQRGEDTYANPEPGFEIESGDMLVAIGTREQQVALEELLGADAEGE